MVAFTDALALDAGDTCWFGLVTPDTAPAAGFALRLESVRNDMGDHERTEIYLLVQLE